MTATATDPREREVQRLRSACMSVESAVHEVESALDELGPISTKGPLDEMRRGASLLAERLAEAVGETFWLLGLEERDRWTRVADEAIAWAEESA